jgi:hypothetical protein
MPRLSPEKQHLLPEQGFILANVIFMGIVFCLPLAPGLFALAVDLPLTLDEAYAGLVLPASAYVLMGKAGARLSVQTRLRALPPPFHAPLACKEWLECTAHARKARPAPLNRLVSPHCRVSLCCVLHASREAVLRPPHLQSLLALCGPASLC